MRRSLVAAGIFVLMAVSFLAGNWVSHRPADTNIAADGRKILHYVDPMHPTYTSDKPGIAPDCGMPLEPVYANGTQSSAGSSRKTALLPGAVTVNADQQQLIGIKTALVEKTPANQLLRLQGRVIPDELRTYVINATIDGWITSVGTNTIGSIVRKDEVLATFYSSEFLSAGQALIYALNSMDRSMGTTAANQAQRDQMQQFNVSLKQYRDSLRNLGMGEQQIEEMIRTRKYMENVDIASPGNGIVIARTVSQGQRFERGKELYRIADLSKVWVLVDTYGAEADFFKPRMQVSVILPNRNRTFPARVAAVPPLFDPASRTLKVRLEIDNPGYVLRPDMFVDVELPVQMPAMLSVPQEALLDSGLKKTVFVEKSVGVFEPREVSSGRSFGSRVEILSGLKPGERIAISGTFLLDSESRMKTAAAGISGTPRQDPVCGMYVDEAKSREKGLVRESGGTTDYFCSEECKQKFLKSPAAKTIHTTTDAAADKRQPSQPVANSPSNHSGPSSHGGMK